MPEVKWIKITTDMFDDEKIKLLEAMPDSDTLLVIWIKLVCQAGKVNAGGYVFLSEQFPYTEEQLATIFNRPVNTVKLALRAFHQLEMIRVEDNGSIFLPNFSKHQNLEGLEKIKEQTRLRVAKHRQLQAGNADVTDGNVTVTVLDIDKEREEDKNKKETKSKYGELKNVLLTDNEYKKLSDLLGTTLNKKIDDLSYYLGSTGKSYKSHYLTILNWNRRDKDAGTNTVKRNPGNEPAGAFEGID